MQPPPCSARGAAWRSRPPRRRSPRRRVPDVERLLAGEPVGHVPALLGRDAHRLVVAVRRRGSPGTSELGRCLRPSSPCSASVGSTATQRIGRGCSRSRREVPMIVPLVPSPATKWVMRSPSAVEDLGAGAVVVRERVVRVRVLVGVEVLLGLRSRRARARLRIAPSEPSIGSLKMISVPKARAMSLRALADVRRHHQRHADAERGAEERVRDAGVAAGRVDEDLRRSSSRPSSIAVCIIRARGAVLHRAAGVRELELGVDLDARRLRRRRDRSRTSGVSPTASTHARPSGAIGRASASPHSPFAGARGSRGARRARPRARRSRRASLDDRAAGASASTSIAPGSHGRAKPAPSA